MFISYCISVALFFLIISIFRKVQSALFFYSLPNTLVVQGVKFCHFHFHFLCQCPSSIYSCSIVYKLHLRTLWTIYSATTFLEKCRKVVREIWFEKSVSRNLIREKWLTRKKGGFIP